MKDTYGTYDGRVPEPPYKTEAAERIESLERENAALKAQLAQARDDEARECLDIAWQHNSCEGIAQNIAAAIERRIQERESIKRVQP